MDPYEEMYYDLFNKITDVIKELQTVQQESEELFLSRKSKENGQIIIHLNGRLWRRP
nr:hypothetical protein [uncultured Caproiciproducens sp.]